MAAKNRQQKRHRERAVEETWTLKRQAKRGAACDGAWIRVDRPSDGA